MQYAFFSILLLTILLAIGLVFFLRAASKDRTTVIDVSSPLPPLEVLNGLTSWLEERGWRRDGGDADRKVLRFNGSVSSSYGLAIFLSILGGLGASCLGLVLSQLIPVLGYWPLLLSIVGAPIAGFVYHKRSNRIESLELKLISSSQNIGSDLRIRAHRDELIAMELDLSKKLKLTSDGKLFSSPI
tara:strand:- start:2703 stop:3260 length:558 start_codon:yes stop_codon:yes gene_type:complete